GGGKRRRVKEKERPVFYWLARALVRLLLLPFCALQVEGAERLPSTGPLILAANHASILDPLLLGVAVRRRITFLGAAYLFSYPGLSLLLRALGVLPVRPSSGRAQWLKESRRLLERGEVLGVFPSGGIAPARAEVALPGAAHLALCTGSPLLPVAIAGSAQVWPLGRWWPRRGKVRVAFGLPIEKGVLSPSNPGFRAERAALIAQVKEEIKALLLARPGPAGESYSRRRKGGKAAF
ncbi:MAG: lysophospholipid acyltransferase family protein, partial [Bacillota bacterium]|nr:lysophospholipid acyltransferase family protein [Bacillota bacterium]